MTEDNTKKAKRIKVSPKNKKPSSSNKIIPNIKQYLIYDFVNCNFENNTLQFTASNAMKSLASTGEIKHLRTLSTIQSIYREKIFWDQIYNWKFLAWDGDKNAELLLETVVKGFRNAIITYKSKSTGRPPKYIVADIDILNEYEQLQRKLIKNVIQDAQIKDVNKIKNRKVSKRSKDLAKINKLILQRRKSNLISFLQGEKIKLSIREIDKMVLKSNSEISIQILVKRYNVGIRKIKERMAIEDPDYKLVVDFKLPNSTIKTIDYLRFCVLRDKAREESNSIESYFSILSEKLGVPVESLKKQIPYIHPIQVRTPHKSRVPSKTPSKK